MKNVTNVYGRNHTIDETTQKLLSYNNDKKVVVYNAEIIDDGKNSGFYTDYIESGIIEDIEQRMSAWNNPIKLAYALMVDFNAGKNDKDGRIWKACVEYVKNHESDFFTKSGNWKQRIRAASNRMELEIVDNKTNL